MVPGKGEVPDKADKVDKVFPGGRVDISAQPGVLVPWVFLVPPEGDILGVPEMEGNNRVPRSLPQSSSL